MELRHSINQRIEELDKFFEDNFDQPFVYNFEKGRIRLKKLLMYEPNLINQLDNGKGIKGLAFGLKPLKENMNVENIVTNASYVNDKGKQSGTTVLKSQNTKSKKTNGKIPHNRSIEKHKHNSNESIEHSNNSKMTKTYEHNLRKKKEQMCNKQQYSVKGNQNKHNEVYNNSNNGNDYSYEDNSNYSQISNNTSHKNYNNKQQQQQLQQQQHSSSLVYKDSKLNQMNEGVVTFTRNNNNNNNSNNNFLVEQSVRGSNNNNNNNELLRGTSMSFKPNNNNNNDVNANSNHNIEKQTNNKEEPINEHEHEPKNINNEIREITLRFKLTEEEYRLLLREKAKIVVQIPETTSNQPLIYSTAIPNLKKTSSIPSKKPLKQKATQLYHQKSSSKSKYK